METRETKQEIEKTYRKTRSILGRARMIHTTLEEIRDLLKDIYELYKENYMKERMK